MLDLRKFQRNFQRRPRSKKKYLIKKMLIEAKHVTSRYSSIIKSQMERGHGSVADFDLQETENHNLLGEFANNLLGEFVRGDSNRQNRLLQVFPDVFEAISRGDIGEQLDLQHQLTAENSVKRQESIKRTNKRFLSIKATLPNSPLQRKRFRTNIYDSAENDSRPLPIIPENPPNFTSERLYSYKKNLNNLNDIMEQDTVKNFEVYFPHNNISKIIDELAKQEKKKNQRINIENIKNTLAPDILQPDPVTGRFMNKQKGRRNSVSSDTSRILAKRDQSPMASRFALSQLLKSKSEIRLNQDKSVDKSPKNNDDAAK